MFAISRLLNSVAGRFRVLPRRGRQRGLPGLLGPNRRLLVEPFEERLCPSIDFSAVADFSNATNTQTSPWSYRFSSDLNRDGSYDLLTANSDPRPQWNPATPYWNLNNPLRDFLPSVGVNRSGVAIPNAPPNLPFTWPNNTVWMHTDNGGLVVVSWLSPTSGAVDLVFSFADIDANGGDGIRYFVDRNNSTGQLATGVLLNGGTSGVLTLTNVAVGAGDRINFLVDPNGNHFFDSTAFTATVAFRFTDPSVGIAFVRAQVVGLPLQDGEIQSLTSKLDAAARSVAADRPSACGQLGAFINEVQALRSTGRLAPAVADALIQQIQDVIGLLA